MLTPDWNSPLKTYLGAQLFPWVLLFIGLVILLFALADVLRTRASADWPATAGTVVRSTLEATAPQANGPSRRAAWRAAIRYHYTVEGASHSGQRVSFASPGPLERAAAEALLQRYPVGADVRVFYRPDAPAESVLEPGLSGFPWLSLSLAGLFCLAGIGMIVVLPRLAGRA
jgi:hypothetical protein